MSLKIEPDRTYLPLPLVIAIVGSLLGVAVACTAFVVEQKAANRAIVESIEGLRVDFRRMSVDVVGATAFRQWRELLAARNQQLVVPDLPR